MTNVECHLILHMNSSDADRWGPSTSMRIAPLIIYISFTSKSTKTERADRQERSLEKSHRRNVFIVSVILL